MSMTPSNVLNNLNQVANDVMVIYIPEVLMTIRTFSEFGDDEVKEIIKIRRYNVG